MMFLDAFPFSNLDSTHIEYLVSPPPPSKKPHISYFLVCSSNLFYYNTDHSNTPIDNQLFRILKIITKKYLTY